MVKTTKYEVIFQNSEVLMVIHAIDNRDARLIFSRQIKIKEVNKRGRGD